MLGDMTDAVESDPGRSRRRKADLRPRRLRRRRHLRHRARGVPASASSEPSPPGICPRASRRATGSPSRRSRSSPPTAIDFVLTVDCGITAVAEVEAAAELGPRDRRHRPSPACRELPCLPGRRAAARRLSIRRAVRHGGRLEARPGTSRGRACRSSTGTSTSSRSPRSPTSCHSSTRAEAWPPPVCADSRRRRSRGSARSCESPESIPQRATKSAIGFRLAPRINAAGRLGRPEAALELLLTPEASEASQLAEQLEELNRERQAVEERILRAANAEIGSWPEERRRCRGYVVAGEDWHEGVIGIVASRLAERYGRPVVLIAGSASGGHWKGSGRAGGTFDLHAGLAACAEHLGRFGGHRAAAGLSIDPGKVEAFAEAFGAYADATLAEEDLGSKVTIDAIVRGSELGLSLCEELSRLAPFGLG